LGFRAHILGAAAGGGLSQWNCGCENCRLARRGSIPAQTRSSLAVTGNSEDWAILNASPDIRRQFTVCVALHPTGLREVPLKSILVTNGDIDHVAGLLTQREMQPFDLFATAGINEVLAQNPIFGALNERVVARKTVALGIPFRLAPGLWAELFAVPGKVPLYLEGETVETDLVGEQTVGVHLTGGGGSAFYIPGCAMLNDDLRARLAATYAAPEDEIAAREAGLYTNLITSGIGLTEKRLRELDAAGLDHIQLSLQGTDAEMADRIGGYRGGFARKMDVARWIREIGFPLTLNAVLHRQNLHQLPRAIEMGVEMGARRIEVATVQFHGWSLMNRDALMPTREQAREADAIVAEARARLKGVLVIDYVPADYHSGYPKPCMGGWGSTGLNVAPDGLVLPCHAAQTIPGLVLDRVQDRPLHEIWYEGSAFNAYRSTDWMPEPCASCERKTIDFGGCRCQAMALVGDATATDPTCIRSPHHAALQARADAFAAGTTAFTARAAAG